ncbi:hypothetical protein [Clostridium perfringens]|uniref:hypothetical protein n=1 Tax=Clostridium perfringens TaxID=1502 RepID=UPI001E5CCC77|nr:hypothetical protein [Clostridium perfringens]WVL78285.1 hypothetical protein LMS42_015085 [Clostridium perfringens]
MVEIKTYKLEELEDGETYIAKGDSTVYRMRDGVLEYRYDDEWRTSLMSYNWLKNQEFIKSLPPKKKIDFGQALKLINDGFEVQSELTGTKYKMIDNYIMQKTLINGLKLKGLKDKFHLEFGEINGIWIVEE